MKIENFEQVKNLIAQIDKHENKLRLLIKYPPTIEIYVEHCPLYSTIKSKNSLVRSSFLTQNSFYKIGTMGNCEHEYHKQAKELIEFIKIDLQDRINNLKSMLEML